jgi:hypothetical protein
LAIRNSLPGVTLCKGVAATVLSCGELGEVLVVLAGNTRFAELLGGAAAAAQPGSAAVSQTSRSNVRTASGHRPQGERLRRLNQIAIRQMQVLTSSNLKALPGAKGK